MEAIKGPSRGRVEGKKCRLPEWDKLAQHESGFDGKKVHLQMADYKEFKNYSTKMLQNVAVFL
jgi:hypothetical protein